jgi:uncharacterized repeat protein (TIGR03803 family)
MRIVSRGMATVILALSLIGSGVLAEPVENVIYRFQGSSDGQRPFGPMSLVADDDGNLYGTTFFGGICPSLNGANNINNCGTVFKLTSKGQTTLIETILYRFTGGSDGANPSSTIINDGALYGTTQSGGNGNEGTIFKLTPPASGQAAWTENVIYRFCSQPGCIDGGTPAALIADSNGSFYGTTNGGGTGNRGFGFGTVFKLTPPPIGQTAWTETVLYRFAGGSDGSGPNGLTIHKNVLYGTTVQGGTGGGLGLGTVFKLTPTNRTTWTETILYRFTGGSDGANPIAAPIAGNTGALYGTTKFGGSSGYGTIFKLTPHQTAWTETVLYSFKGGSDGANPAAGLIADHGTFYGTTDFGGGTACPPYGACGTVFKLTPSGGGTSAETVLYRFTGGTDGALSQAGLIARRGTLYGTTTIGGICPPNPFAPAGCGTVFKLTP